MANTFLLKTATNLTTSLATKYTAATSNLDASVVIGMTFCNKHTSSVSVYCKLVTNSSSGENSDDIMLLNDVAVPAGSTLEFCSGNKLVLQADDYIQVKASVADKIDWSMSIMEIT